MSGTSAFRFGTIVALFIIFTTIFRYGEAIICYQCNSEYDPRCGDPFDSYSLGTVNCSFQPRLEHLGHLEPTICRKIFQKTYGKIRVVRGCGFISDSSDNKECLMRSGTHDVRAVYCGCTEDLCNASNVNNLSSILTIGFTAFFLMWKRI